MIIYRILFFCLCPLEKENSLLPVSNFTVAALWCGQAAHPTETARVIVPCSKVSLAAAVGVSPCSPKPLIW